MQEVALRRRLAPRITPPRLLAALRANALKRDVALLIGLFAVCRVYAVAGIDPARYPDSGGYFSLDFLGGAPRLWTVPLLFNSLPSDSWRVAAQVALAIACWGTLAAVVAGIPRNPVLARVGAAAILGLGLTRQVTAWDLAILSEATAVSLTVLSVAALLLVARRRTTGTLAFLFGAVTIWAFARHANLLLLLAVLPFAITAVLWRLERRRAVVVGLALIVLGAWAGLTIGREDQVWRLNSYAILTNRILPDAEATAYFQERGLTVKPVMRQGWLNARGPAAPGLRDPDTQAFLTDHWRPAYAGWLLRNPVDTVSDPMHAISGATWADAGLADPRTSLPPPLQDIATSSSVRSVPLALLLVAALWAFSWWRRREATATDAAAALVVALGVVWFMIVYHTATELVRPSVAIAIMLRIGLLVLVLLAVDRLLTAQRAHVGHPA